MSEAKRDDHGRGHPWSLTFNELVGYQRAEFARASAFRTWLIVCQFAVAVPGALSVLVEDGATLYYLAGAGVILLLVWLLLDNQYREHRLAGERARRATLVMQGLGVRISPEEVFDLRNGLKVKTHSARDFEDAGYFATKAEAGTQRLAEMLEESAFWSETLQATSAAVMRSLFGGLLALGVLGIYVAVPFTDSSTMITGLRIFLAILVFGLSSDVLIATRAHAAAARTIGDIRKRLQTAASNGYREADVLYLMSEYNAAVEAAPVVVPLAYKLKRDELNERWRSYVAERVSQDAAKGKATASDQGVA